MTTETIPYRYCQNPDCRKQIELGCAETMARYQERKYCSRKCFGSTRRSVWIEHGTTGGYQKCRRTGGPCPSCQAAQARDWSERRVHRRAVAALVALHPVDYWRLRAQLANLRGDPE